MKQQLAILADAANVTQEGKLNILGQFSIVFPPETPTTYPLLWFVAMLELGAADFGKHPFLLRLVDGEGDTVMTPLTGEIDLPKPADYSGDPLYLPVLLQVANTQLPDYGTYTFELRFDEQIVAEVPLMVREPPKAASVP